mgnify:FL=1
MPSLMEISNYCSNAGYGIHSNEMFLYVNKKNVFFSKTDLDKIISKEFGQQ